MTRPAIFTRPTVFTRPDVIIKPAARQATAHRFITHHTAYKFNHTDLLKIFESPLYNGVIEPIYVGHKTPIWTKQLKDSWNYIMMNSHDKYHSDYKRWKKIMNRNDRAKYAGDMAQYEKAYWDYKKNPTSTLLQKRLLRHTQRINNIVHEINKPKHKQFADQIHDFYG